MFRAEDTTRANYRSLFEYAAGVEARLAQDRRLAYYHKVLPELLHRVKGLPLMYTTYSKGWNPDSNREAFIVKRRVPDLSKPLYIEDDEGNTIQKGYTTQDFVIEGDEDVNDFMIRKNRFKGQHGFNKGFGYLAPVYHVERDEMPFIQVDLDIDQADFKKPAWNKLLQAVTKVYDWFRSEGFDPLINFTGSSFHIWAKDGKVRSYAEIKEILTQLSKDTKLPLAAGAAHIVNQITIDYPQNKYRAPMRFPLSIHGDTGLASIIIPRNQLRKFDPLKKAHPDQVLKQLPNHLAKIDAWFDDLPTSKQSAEDIITSHLATLDEADIERCMWGDCGVLADELMAKLQAAGYTDAVYEIGRAYIHPFEEYDDKTFIGGHVVVTVDGVSYDALGAGAKQRWKDSSVLVDILSQHGYDELGPLLSAHLTIDWITSTWDEVQETRRHNFAGRLVDFESEEMTKTWYSSGNVFPWQLFLDTETIGPDLFGERDNYPYEDMKALESKYGLKPDSAVIWVSEFPEVAASYMIGQGLLDISDDEVGNWYGFSKSDLETTEFGQIYYPPHVEDVWQYQGTVIPETDDGDGGYLLALNRDYTGKYGLKRIGMAAETEYKKKRQKPTPEPGVEGSGKLKPTRRKPPMKVKGSDVYSVQKHRATKRGSHRDIRIGLDGKLLSFVPVGRYEKKDDNGKWQKTDGSRLPKKIGDGVSVIRTEDHPFDYWWFEGEIPKDSYGAGPVSLETYGTRRIIEWKPNKKLKVEFIGGKYAGTYTFERSKKSKDGKVWWMRKSRPVPKDKKDKKTKKAEISDEGYCSECGEHWMDIRTQEGKGLKFDDGPWEECWNCYTQFENFNEDEFDYYTHMFTQDVVEGQTVKKYVDSIHDGYFSWSDALDDLEFTLQKVPLSVWDNIERSEVDGQWIDAPVYSHRLSNTLLQFRNQHPDDDYPPVVLKLDESGNYEVIDGFHRLNALQILGRDSVRAWVGTPVVNRKTKKAEEKWYGPPALEAVMNEDVRDQYGYSMFSKALTEWSEKFLAGERNAKEMVERAYYEDGAGPGDGLIVDYDPSNGIVDIESGVSSHYGLSASEAIERFARRYVEELLISAKYYRGRIKLYRGIQLVNPEDFDPTEVGQSWTPIKTAAKPYFGFQKYYSRNLERIYSRTADSETYVLTALVPVESINWYYTLMRALAFGLSDEKEIVLKGGATIELIDIPLDLSFAIDATPEALIRAAEEDEGDKAKFEGKYIAKVAEYTSSNKWREDVEAMDQMGDETYIYALEGRLEYMFPKLEHPLSQAEYDELKSANPELIAEENAIARSISDDMLHRLYEMLFGSGGDFYGAAEYYNGKILLYREIDMEDSADLNMAKAGIFWTPVLSAAKAHWGIAGDSFILRALVDFEDIVWDSSWYANLIMPEECEIRLKQGAEIELLPLTDAKRYYGGKYMLGAYVYPEEIVFEIDAPNPNILAVERGTETELLEAMKDLPEEYRRLMGISEVEPQPTQTGFASEDIDLTVGEAFDKALAEIRADVDSVQPHSKDLSDVTFEDYNMAKAVYQSFIVPAGITGSIVRDEWYYESEPIYLWSDIFTLPEGSAGEEWKQKIDAQKTEKESDILASNEINYAFYWYAIMQINSIYSMLLSRLVQKFGNVPGGVYAGPPVELPEIIESQRDSTDIKIYRWLATSQGDEPVRRLRNRMRPVDLNYYGGYSLDYLDGFGGAESVQEMIRKGLKSLSYGPCWSLSPDAYTRTDQWRLAQEDVIHKENEKVGISLKRKLMDEEIDTRTYVIEKSIPASGVDWYSTLISSALWLDSPEYEVIPKRGVFLSEEITDKSDFEQVFDKAVAAARSSFEEYGWFGAADLNDVSDLHNDAAGRERLLEVERHLAMLKRPGSLLWSSGDDQAYDAYPDDLRDPTYIFQDSGIFVDEDGKTDGYTDEERGKTYEEDYYFFDSFDKSPNLDIRLRYAYTLNCISKLAEQYFNRLIHLKNHLKPQFASGEVTLYRAFSLPEGEVPELRRMTVFPLSMQIGNARRMENKEQRVKYTYESYGKHWSFLPGFEWSDDFPSEYGTPYIMEKQIPYTDVDWFTTLLVMAYGREVEYEVAVNEDVFLAENEVKIPLYHVTPLDQVGTILETGLEPRIGPRSEGMELEPRVYLFGDGKESMQDSFIWEEMFDENYGNEWKSGYAVLQIDLPADWFQKRRVEKTFEPDGPETSWEWSTQELIPAEYISIEEEWEWDETQLLDFEADARNQAELDYPLRLYHGTSVHNWQAIQATGELRTGCLASSEGYDIDMPSTYIDLAIDEIEDDHPDVNDGGVVLKITFPSKAVADQYLEADNTMYDLGMAVLEDDLYSRYAPADWKPEDAEEGWHYGPMNWFITDFSELVEANQATKTIPYYPQDLSDWQASYLSVYSVCIKQPIPMEYITVDWGSESRRAEEETSETVGEAWDKAVTDWNLLAEWALYELDQVEKGREIKQVTKKDYQQALDIYKIIDKYSGFMFRDIGMWPEELPGLIPSITDDLESKKLLERQSLDLFDIEGKMNYYFYYALLSWVRGMNWGITGEPGSPIGDYKLNEIILSQFRSPTVKAYRWISTKKDVQPFRRLSRHKYVLSYGDHWSLHPDAYKLTGEWEGVVSSQDYLIEKEVPVEDIDWFATLISCLSWYYNPEFEIIMKPTTYIAETINEPHLYLDMDGCFADFAGAITQRVNEVLQVQDISSIPSKSLRRAARKAKVLGITSVSESDFDLSLSHDPVRKKVIDRMLYKIASEPGFFYNLEVMNRDILEEIVASGRPFSFLSAPIGGTNDYSIEDKRAWVRDRLGLDVAVNVVPREEKITFCYPGDILIDDHATTIAEWSSAGGRGILFPQEIESFLRKPYNGETTTNVAEEVNNVNQYPIMYKKTATGTLQQWQVLLLPQESGGYLLTTASGKVDGAITQGRGKLITEGKVNRTALEQAELEADSKFKKKKDEGYFATKEEAMNNLVVLPMLAHNFEKRSHDIRYPAVAQRKFDGVRCLAITQADGSVRLMTRKGKDFAHLNHLREQIEALNIEPNMVLDGEVYSDSLTFQEATGLVRRQTLKPGDEDKLSQIDYRLYDAILLDRPETTFLDRYSKLAALFPTSSSVEGRRMGNLVLTENFPLRGPEDIMSLHSQFTGDEEFEGVMIRNLHGTYDLNKRSKHLQKFKTFQDAEYKIVGFNEAGGNWQGTPIWICEMEDGRQFNVTPVGDRPSRIEMFKNVDDYIGKMLTVKFFELTDDGIPRFGNGIAIRDYE